MKVLTATAFANSWSDYLPTNITVVLYNMSQYIISTTQSKAESLELQNG